MADIPSELAAELRDRYTLERELGRGGMATVYLARDLKHDRPVALKVIRPELSSCAGSERFQREISFAARLQHPHILPLLDSGQAGVGGRDAGSLLWFTMPHVEGQSLRDLLRQEGRLPLDDALRIAREAAQALQYAHEHGVVHRDIKPENLLLTPDGNTLVADFGIARALGGGDGERLTETGLAIGTPQYMSPEQATAAEVDARTDQYSLACVVYELLCGEPPFTGPTPQAVIARSLNAPRPSIRLVRETVPPEVDSAVSRALARDPVDRFSSVAAFAESLGRAAAPVPLPSATPAAAARRVPRRTAVLVGAAILLVAGVAGTLLLRPRHAGPVAPEAEVIAVLPFRASGAGLEVMSEGMVDLLARDLDAVGGVRTVDPRTVLRRWRRIRGGGADLSDALKVGREVGAGSVLTGSVVEAGSQVRLDAELRSVAGQPLARARIDGPADSLLDLVDRLGLALLRDVWRSREPVPNLRLGSLTTNSIEALRAFLEGERFYRLSSWDSAKTAFTRAVQADSGFALAHMRLAMVVGWRDGMGSREYLESGLAALRHADRLSERDRSLLRGYQLFAETNPAALDTARDYLRQYPDDVEARFLLGEILFHFNRLFAFPPDSSIAAFGAVLRLDSSLTPALIHPAEAALSERDSAAYARYVAAMERITGAEDPTGRAAMRVVWGPRDAVRDSLLRTVIFRAGGNAIGTGQGVWLAEWRDPRATSDWLIETITLGQRTFAPDNPFRLQAMLFHSMTASGLGRVAEGRRLADSLATRDFRMGGISRTFPILVGITPRAPIADAETRLRAMADRPVASMVLAELALARGEAAKARAILARARASDSAKASPVGRSLLDATEGWADLLEGDTALGIQRIATGLRQPGAAFADAPTVPLFLQWALALTARPETRAEGIRRLRYGFNFAPAVLPLTFLALGQAYDAEGNHAEAVHFYTSFLRLWDRADPELQPWVRRAREAVSAEPVDR
jgi:eukaryotic-like serine/threonine-protein kinase